MKYKIGTWAVAAVMAASPVMADLVFPSLSYRTGPYAANGIPFADGYADYFTLLNERDGGIGGVMTRVPECETGYNTEKGVECYESTKGDGALVYQPLSTGITYQLIPKATADGIPVHSMGYGRTSAKDGTVFRNIFNYPANYWDGASFAIKHLLDENEGSLEGKKIALVYHNSAYGKEPIRTLEELSEKHGFELLLLAVDHPGQEQKSQWLQIRRERPDNVIMYGWGVMNQVAIQEASNIRFRWKISLASGGPDLKTMCARRVAPLMATRPWRSIMLAVISLCSMTSRNMSLMRAKQPARGIRSAPSCTTGGFMLRCWQQKRPKPHRKSTALPR